MELRKIKISGVGYAVPPRILTNDDLSKMVDTSDEWIRSMTGIVERHIADPGMNNSDFATIAAKNALAMSGIPAEEIDMIIVSTITPDMVFPATACLVQHAIGARHAATFDLEAACSGFIYGISVARQFLATGECKNVLVIASELLSRITDWTDRSTCVLFGDGAGAVILTGTDEGESDILSTVLGGDGKHSDILYLPAGGSRKPASHETVDAREHTMKMNGPETFKLAVTKMNACVKLALKRAGLAATDIDIVIPHQANLRIIEMLRKTLDLPEEKVYVNLQKYGNTSAATIAIALAELVESGRVKRGDIIAMCAFGGGLTWAANILRY